MKRDQELIHQLLKYAEAEANGCGHTPSSAHLREQSGRTWPRSEIHYHIELCHEAGYLKAKKSSFRTGKYVEDTCIRAYAIVNLTWAGHEELKREAE